MCLGFFFLVQIIFVQKFLAGWFSFNFWTLVSSQCEPFYFCKFVYHILYISGKYSNQTGICTEKYRLLFTIHLFQILILFLIQILVLIYPSGPIYCGFVFVRLAQFDGVPHPLEGPGWVAPRPQHCSSCSFLYLNIRNRPIHSRT